MPSPLHLLGHHATRRFLNFRLGWDLMRDPEVAIAKKGTALLVGAGITIALVALEIPLEGLVAFLIPFVGAAVDTVIDGAELILLPLIIALGVLPYLVRSQRQTHLVPAPVADHVERV